MVDSSPRYVAHVKIEKVTPRDTRATENKRDVEEVSQITVKAGSIEGLRDKLTKHIAIITED